MSTLLRRLALLIAAALLTLAGNARAQATRSATLPTLTPLELNLLHQMETGTWRQRKAAADELIDRGAWEVPAVTQMLALTHDPDAQSRLQALLRRLIHDRALGPSMVTLHMKNASAKAVYTELFRQSWAPLLTTPDHLLDDPSLPKISIDVDHKPFWLVMRELEGTTGLGLGSDIDGNHLRRGARIVRGPAAISGPFLVILAGVRPTMAEAQSVTVDLSIYAEPKVHLVGVDQNMQVDQAVDDKRNVLQQSQSSSLLVPEEDFGPWQLSVAVISPNKNGGSLVRFKAKTSVSIAVTSEHVEISDLMHAKPRSVSSGPGTITFLNCRKSGTVYQLSFSSAHDPLDQFHKVNVEQPGWQMKLLDATGQILPRAETVIPGDNANQMTLIYGPKLFGKPFPEPAKLIWNAPSDIQVVDLNVDFGTINIPLPGF